MVITATFGTVLHNVKVVPSSNLIFTAEAKRTTRNMREASIKKKAKFLRG